MQPTNCIPLNYDEFAQLYAAGRISGYNIGSFNEPISTERLLRRKEAMKAQGTELQEDWEQATQAIENAIWAQLPDVDYIYLHVAIKDSSYFPVSVNVRTDNGEETTRHTVQLDESLLTRKLMQVHRPTLVVLENAVSN